MPALLPISFKLDEAENLKWTQQNENLAFYYHLRNTCSSFPSLILGYSAAPNAREVSAIFAEGLLSVGINVFLTDSPCPIVALSQSIGMRGMPIVLYLDISEVDNLCSVIAINNHGGPIDEKDINDQTPPDNDRTAVVGETGLLQSYVNRLAELADPFIEDGISFSEIVSPFPELLPLLKREKKLKHLLERDANGPIAVISLDGQRITVKHKDGRPIDTETIVEQIGSYLYKERMAQGTIVGPKTICGLSSTGDFIKATESAFEMSYFAGFSDLFLGWWQNGTIAHQGSSCFGDAYLSAIYLIEAWRNNPELI